MTLPPYLESIRAEIEGHARDFGLDFFETIFEVVGYDRINEIAAFGGFPTRYPHWRFGMEYDQLSKSYEYGLSKIYEMVINTDPAYAYLMEGNNLMDQRTVIAHVFGHVDFFKNNYYFSFTDRKMVDKMANHATRVRRLIDRLGIEKVEAFIDTCLSVENLIDYQGNFIARPPARPSEDDATDEERRLYKMPAREYMEEYINPPDFVASQQKRMDEEREARRHFPWHPQRDVLQFLLEYAPLEGWENDILQIIREEAVYFAPQGMTKIMNEGWATFWHSRILCERVLPASELIDYAETYAGVVATHPGRLNPYKLGIEIFRDIRERWDRGMFGEEWENCDSMAERESWNRDVGAGMEKIFQVRALYNDISFIDEFLTPDLIERQQLYTFGYNPKARRWEIESRQFQEIKDKLLDSMTNFGQPTIAVRDANFRNSAHLLLSHRYLGTPLRMDYASLVLQNLYRIWKRPVFLETVAEDKGCLIGFDGDSMSKEAWEAAPLTW